MDWEKKLKRRSAALIIGLFLGFGGLLFIINSASAQETYTRTPGDSGNAVAIQNPVNFDFSILITQEISDTCTLGAIPDVNTVFLIADTSEGLNFVLGSAPGGLGQGAVGQYKGINVDKNFNEDTIVYNVRAICTANYNLTNGDQNIEFIENSYLLTTLESDVSGLFTAVNDLPSSGNIFGEKGILGTSTFSLMAGVVTGVQNTGANLWPLFVFLGVPLALIIGFMLIQFIFMSVGAKKREEIAEFDNEKADSLKEFYSRDGGIDPDLKSKIVRGSKNNTL